MGPSAILGGLVAGAESGRLGVLKYLLQFARAILLPGPHPVADIGQRFAHSPGHHGLSEANRIAQDIGHAGADDIGTIGHHGGVFSEPFAERLALDLLGADYVGL